MNTNNSTIMDLISRAAGRSKNAEAFVPRPSSLPDFYFTAKSKTSIELANACSFSEARLPGGGKFEVNTPTMILLVQNKYHRRPLCYAGRN